MNIQQLPAFEKLIHEHIPLFDGVRVPTPIFFRLYLTQKKTAHIVLTLVALDQHQHPCFVIKLSERGTPESEEAIHKEFQVLVTLSEIDSLKGTIPKPVNCFRMGHGLFALYQYSHGHMLFLDVEQCQTIFLPDWISVPINWLKKFQGKTRHGYLTRDHLNTLINKERNRISLNFQDALNPIIDDLLSKMDNRLERLLSHEIPIGVTHGDYNLYNIGIQDGGAPIIFDWEDCEFNYPILFDYFYFYITFKRCLFWPKAKGSKLKARFINENMDRLVESVNHWIGHLQEQYPIMTIEDIDTLFLLFLIRKICLNSESKRQSQEKVESWLLILDQINTSPFILNYFEEEKIQLLKEI